MVVQCDSTINLVIDLTNKNQCLTKVVDEACWTVRELDIPKVEPIDVQVRKLTARVCDTRTELAEVQLELNLKITELQLKAQPLTLPKVRMQCATIVADAVAAVASEMMECTTLFEQFLELLTKCQENTNVQRLETEAWELQ